MLKAYCFKGFHCGILNYRLDSLVRDLGLHLEHPFLISPVSPPFFAFKLEHCIVHFNTLDFSYKKELNCATTDKAYTGVFKALTVYKTYATIL